MNMSDDLRDLMSALSNCEPGKGAELVESSRRIAAGGVRRGWIEWMEAGGLRVHIITKKGRAALAA